MCDFLSICVRRDGAIAHIPGNSHTGAVAHFEWRENDQMAELRGKFFVEAEWNCQGEFPGVDKITRSGSLNEKQRKVIETFYTNAAKLLSDPAAHAERMCAGTGYFADPQYADIRWKVLIDERCPKLVATKLAKTELYADGTPIKSLHPAITKLKGKVVIAESAEITSDALTEIGGSLYVSQGVTLTVPALTEIGGSLDVREGATLTVSACRIGAVWQGSGCLLMPGLGPNCRPMGSVC